MNENVIYLVPAFGILGLIVMAYKSAWVGRQDAGDDKMRELAGYIADGAMAFLRAEWKVLSIFVLITAALLAYSGTIHEVNGRQIHSSWVICIAFIIGAVFSATAGYIGMRVATKANVRTTQAARQSLKQALKVSFTGGTVMGLGVAGLAVLGLGGLFIAFLAMFAHLNNDQVRTAIEVLTGFSLGAESIALFSRVGGGIYTKAADVGADLVGKVEAGIPEDDVRNPATIADNVGDNVGDVAGMGADLFGSYVATILATMVLGQEVNVRDSMGGMAPILLPMIICGLGIVFSIVGTFFVRIKDENANVQNALNLGNWLSMILTVIASYFVVNWMLPEERRLRRNLHAQGIQRSSPVYHVGAIASHHEYYTTTGKVCEVDRLRNSSTGHCHEHHRRPFRRNEIDSGADSTPPGGIMAVIISQAFTASRSPGGPEMMATTAMQLAIDVCIRSPERNAGGRRDELARRRSVNDRQPRRGRNTTAATGGGFDRECGR
ncbi:MAG: sodium/proton-translocating pyrophosphatase [Pyrinomonadaceae bacterium]